MGPITRNGNRFSIPMIISASRRTDIPAFFSDWFLNRLNEGHALVRNPMNPKMVSRIILSPDTVDCIVFWTKNPYPLMGRLEELEKLGYRFYFLFSLNGYGSILEEHVPPVEQVVDTFRSLSGMIGKERVVWRYDPVIFSHKMDVAFHIKHFGGLAESLKGFTDACIFSFLDLYKKCERNLRGHNIFTPDGETMQTLSAKFMEIAKKNGLALRACAEDLQRLGLRHLEPARCIDDSLVSRIIGRDIRLPKDKNQRALCGCVESIDIGAYNTCGHLCRYCYANSNSATVKKNLENHHPGAPFLIGGAEEGDVIHDRGN